MDTRAHIGRQRKSLAVDQKTYDLAAGDLF
jgi:hypothetical protein